MLLLYFYSKGFLFMKHISIPLIASLTCLQIIKFYVLIQEWEDKTEVLQSSLYRLNSGENISKLVVVICSSWIFNFIALVFFTKPLLSLCASQWLKSQWIDMPYFISLFKFHFKFFCIYYFKIHKCILFSSM